VLLTDIVELPPEVTDEGENDTLTPLGAPDADNETDSALPDVTAVETVEDVEPPAVSDPELGEAEIEKSLGGGGAPPEVFRALSSRTKSVVPPAVSVSVPVNFTVIVWPM
jgi:hypothetical protein